MGPEIKKGRGQSNLEKKLKAMADEKRKPFLQRLEANSQELDTIIRHSRRSQVLEIENMVLRKALGELAQDDYVVAMVNIQDQIASKDPIFHAILMSSEGLEKGTRLSNIVSNIIDRRFVDLSKFGLPTKVNGSTSK